MADADNNGITEKSMSELMDAIRAPYSFRPHTMPIADWQLREYFGWTDEMIELRHKVGV